MQRARQRCQMLPNHLPQYQHTVGSATQTKAARQNQNLSKKKKKKKVCNGIHSKNLNEKSTFLLHIQRSFCRALHLVSPQHVMGQTMPYSTPAETDFSTSWYLRGSKRDFSLLQLGSQKRLSPFTATKGDGQACSETVMLGRGFRCGSSDAYRAINRGAVGKRLAVAEDSFLCCAAGWTRRSVAQEQDFRIYLIPASRKELPFQFLKASGRVKQNQVAVASRGFTITCAVITRTFSSVAVARLLQFSHALNFAKISTAVTNGKLPN